MHRRIRRVPAVIAVAAGLMACVTQSALAEDFPGQGGIRVQTNGPGAPIEFGDWYSSPLRAGGAGDHFVEIQVPRGWPGTRPIDVDIFSAEMNRSGTPISRALDEVPAAAAAGDTEFEVYGPDILAPSPRTPRPGGNGSIVRRTYAPTTDAEQWVRLATISRPRPGGTYLVRAEASGGDQNGWTMRIGDDDDSNPNDAPPTNYDNPDGADGSGDELGISPVFVAYQHFGADGECHTFSRFVDAGSTETRFNNFDMDLGNAGVVPAALEHQVRLRYYAPGDTFDATGHAVGSIPSNHTAAILSGNGVWNGGTRNTKVGDVFENPQAGWWRIVYCTNAGNQYIVEADGVEQRPAAPLVRASMSDGLLVATRGSVLTYRVDISNEASGPSAGAAANLSVTDLLPPELEFLSCRVLDPFRGPCRLNASGDAEAVVRGLLRAGRTAQVEVKVRVAATAADDTQIVNRGVVRFTDTFSNRYPEVKVLDETRVTGDDDPDPAVDPPPGSGGPAF
jgi:uncharacterized repeat protein (TIGR01451 family)